LNRKDIAAADTDKDGTLTKDGDRRRSQRDAHPRRVQLHGRLAIAKAHLLAMPSFSESLSMMDRRAVELVLISLLAAFCGGLAWALDHELFAVAFAAAAVTGAFGAVTALVNTGGS